ncbi:MAG: hypothetical protein JW821_02200 [Deltaproteobacteria bacterium]|nr:hypothetical protein [Deltaproteobacteria bacterium]
MKTSHLPFVVGIPAVLVFLAFFFTGCGPRYRHEALLDSPEHHTVNGFKLISKGRLSDAKREFDMALQLDAVYSPAYRGQALALGMSGEFDPAFGAMSKALSHARKKEDMALAHVILMRLNAMKQGEGWMERVKGNFHLAIAEIPDFSEAYYYLGMALKQAFHLQEAEEAFRQVLGFNRLYAAEARSQLRILDKIRRADPRTALEKRISVQDHITRAETAALLVHDLNIAGMLGKGTPAGSAAPPEEAGREAPEMPQDAGKHAFRKEIGVIIGLDIQGLRPFSDGTFEPEEAVARAGYALIIAHVFERAKGKTAAPGWRYRGGGSPFEDVSENTPYYDAILLCTRGMGVMEPEGGRFDPLNKISGADALLAIRKLKEKLEDR